MPAQAAAVQDVPALEDVPAENVPAPPPAQMPGLQQQLDDLREHVLEKFPQLQQQVDLLREQFSGLEQLVAVLLDQLTANAAVPTDNAGA